MAVVTYIAKHSIAPGHTIDTEYTILVKAKELQKTFGIKRDDSESISGYRESVIQHRWREWNFKTIPLNATESAIFEEFLDSVLGGEVFDLDVSSNDTGNTPNLMQVQIDSKSVQRVAASGNAYFSYSFNVREYVTR